MFVSVSVVAVAAVVATWWQGGSDGSREGIERCLFAGWKLRASINPEMATG